MEKQDTTTDDDQRMSLSDHRNDAPQDQRLGRYSLVREIGRGFSSVVYEAFDLVRQRTVALKVLTFFQNLDPSRKQDLSERFAREARAISALSHPGIVAIYEVGSAHDGREFIAMEYLSGASLRDRLQRETRLQTAEAVEIALQVADALQFAHEHGIIHRDVKPDNVFLLPDGRVKLMDFGVAHVLSDKTLTQTGIVVGSPAYMSPEQINGEHLDGRTDIFSLGAMLAEMIVGHKPFDAATIPAVMYQILYRPPQMEAVGLPALRKVIEKALMKKRSARFQSAEAFSAVLRKHVLPALPQWEPTSTVVMPALSPDRKLGSAARPSGTSGAGRRRSATLAALGLGSLAAVAFAAAYWSAGLGPGRSRPRYTVSTEGRAIRRAEAHRRRFHDVGVVRRIPAFWVHAPAPAEAATKKAAPVQAAIHEGSPAADRRTIPQKENLGIRIVETRQPVVHTVLLPHMPERPSARAAIKPTARRGLSIKPQTALLASLPAMPHLSAPLAKPARIRIDSFRQEQKSPDLPVFTGIPKAALEPPEAAGVEKPQHGFSDPDQEIIGPLPATANQGGGKDYLDQSVSPQSEIGLRAAPRLIRRTAPIYPQAALAAGLKGRVTLWIFIDKTGFVSGAKVLNSSGEPLLDSAAIRTVLHWKYAPAFLNGQPVPGEAIVHIRFRR
jgi:serine/threonine-protein kinase